MAEENGYISPEQHSQLSRETNERKKVTMRVSYIYGAIIVIVLCIVFFAIGDVYGKHHAPASKAVATSRFGGGTGFTGGAARAGGFGTVTSVSSNSITISNTRTNASTTYTINSSTTITDNGQTGSLSDIQSGDRVIVTTASTTSTVASKIDVNPSFGGGQSAPAAGSSTTGSQSTN